MPANWPKNELIGEKVIIPAAADLVGCYARIAKIKKGEIEGYDWWFSYLDAKPNRRKTEHNQNLLPAQKETMN